jgi:hypothetical protein
MARRKKTTEEKPTEVTGSSDDNFGLPDIDYTPIDRTEEGPVNQETSLPEAEPVQTQTEHYSARSESTDSGTTSQSSYESSYTYTPPKEEGSMIPKIVGIIVVVLLALAATYYFAVYKPQQQAEEKALLEKKRKDAEAKEQERLAEQQRLEEERRRAQVEADANAKPKEGSIETLSERTKRYYVVVSSSIDGDLVMDYAKKLSANGVNCKIIPPYGKVKFSRLTIAEGDTYANAQSIADGLKGQYGDGLWVIKY